MVTIDVQAGGLIRRFETTAAAISDLSGPLRAFGAHLKRRALERYHAQDFAPLAESTVQRRAQKGLRTLERKLHRDVRRAVGRQTALAPRTSPGLLGRLLGGGEGATLVQGATSRGARNRMAVLAEFERRHGKAQKASTRAQAAGVTLSIKQQVSLGAREDRAVGKAVSKPILGNLPPDTLELDFMRESVTLMERTDRQWSETLNKGGTAGHGAQIPARVTVTVDDTDLELFAELLVQHALIPLTEK